MSIAFTYERGKFAAASIVLVLTLGLWTQGQGPEPRVIPKKPAPQASQNVPEPTHQMTASDVEAFLDGVLPLQLAREDIAGAVVVLVKDGKVFFAKGYGYSDVAKKAPVYPDRTMFRPGSISKLFTWTAVMQLVEQGKLDLDRDVNEYLDFKFPATYPQPITLRNLMTHTPGFEENAKNSAPDSARDLRPLGDFLKSAPPRRIFPPGMTPAYSNYGAALAGYIVERVSGEPFNDYIEQHIFKPLGMTHSSFRQPLPGPLQPAMSEGYKLSSEPAKPFELINDVPAGSLSAAGMDIANFMIAHLQDGRFEGAQILRAETARLMHSRQFVNLPEMNAMALGFYEESRNGHRIIGHGGDLNYFHSDLHLIPDAGFGFFISYNSAGKGEIDPREASWPKFLDRYFPYKPTEAAAAATASRDAETVSGHYIASRGWHTAITKMGTLISEGDSTVTANDDGTISVSGSAELNGQPKRFREIAPLLFRDINGQDKVAFKREQSGRLIMFNDFPAIIYWQAPLSENSALNLAVIIVALATFALTLLAWPIVALLRRHYGKTIRLTSEQRRLRILIRLISAINLAFAAAFVGTFALALRDNGLLSDRLDPCLRLIQLIGWLGVLGTALLVYRVARSWTDGDRGLWSKLGNTAVALAGAAFVWFIFTWKMLAFSLIY